MILTDDKGGWKTLFIRDADVDVYSSMNLFPFLFNAQKHMPVSKGAELAVKFT